jgi:two-component system response regulator CpxR
MKRVLIIDDDVELCGLLSKMLSREGFAPESTHTGEFGVIGALSGEFQIIILDVMLPDTSGFEVLRRIRNTSRIPVIMLTARDEEIDRVIGLEIGADDYLPKPFSSRELVARINAVLRRIEPAPVHPREPANKVCTVSDLSLDPASRTVFLDSTSIEMTTAEFDVLLALARAAGRVVDREEIAKLALGKSLSPFDRSVDMLVSKIRRKLGRYDDGTDRIKAIRSAGYLYSKPRQ